uniref:Si:dkey-106n21.1 n=1 Tax=Cyprinus carpio TaxID=7962 RepID=A0A8C1UBX0_CYPCA
KRSLIPTAHSLSSLRLHRGEEKAGRDLVFHLFIPVSCVTQHYILAFGGILAIPLILAEPLKSQLISTIFVSGMSTLLQTTLGTRYWDKHSSECELYTLPEEKVQKCTVTHIREIQGAILVASVLQLVLGLSCLVGLVLRFIRPLGIAPTINLTGLSLFIQAVQKSGAHWGIAALTVCVILLFSQYLSKVNLPLIANKDKKWKVFQYPLFKLFSVTWLVCFLLTYFNALPSSLNEYGFMARTDINLDELLTLAFLGHGNGTTSYSQNIATLGIARVGSRLVFQTAGLLMIILGLFGKLSAVFITIPDPVIGGMFLVMFGMVAAVGISNLQYVDLNSSRNLLILGFSTFSGLVLPTWFHSNPGIKELDQLIMILFTTHMFTDGFFGFVLDNTIPGTEEERGIWSWRKAVHEGSQIHVTSHSCYNLSFCTNFTQRYKLLHYLPFLPSVKSQELGTHL